MYLGYRADMGLPAWTAGAQLNVTLSMICAAWKLVTPVLIHFELLH